MIAVRDRESYPVAEQTLLRAGFWQQPLTWIAERYASALRWSGAPGALLHSPTAEEEPALLSELTPAALRLVDRGELLLVERTGHRPAYVDSVFAATEAKRVLADPAWWLRPLEPPERRLLLALPATVAEAVRAELHEGTPQLPDWEELTEDEQSVLQCACEPSAWLTGLYGCLYDSRLDEPGPELQGAARDAVVDEQFDVLSGFVSAGWIEVVHTSDSLKHYTVIPLDRLRAALADPQLRYQGDDWGVGLTCWFTTAGERVWFRRVRFD